MQMEMQRAPSSPEASLFDWELDLERLEREAKEAAESGRRDDLALAEAECSLDLVDAEIMALRSAKAEAAEIAKSLAKLHAWRARILRVIQSLSSASAGT